MIKQENGEWCVYRHEGKDLVKARCYPTEAEAKAAKDELTRRGEYGYASYIDEASAKGVWAKVSGNEHPHAACVAMMKDKVDDPHAFCAAVEKAAAGTTPAERAAKKHQAYNLDLRGVEVFATGVHNGDKYDEQDLDDMVEAFKRLDFQPPLKSGHSKDEPGMPSLGYVANLRRQGQKLVADFTHMPQIVYDYIKDRRFNRVSAEVYWNLKRGKDSFRRALKAVALLGADIPAVAGLRPLHELFAAEAGDVHTAEAINLFSSQGGNSTQEGHVTPEELKAMQDKHAAEVAERDKKIAEQQTAIDANGKALAELTKKFEDLSKSTSNLDDVRRNALVAESEARAKAADTARASAEAAAKAAKDAQEAAEAALKAERERVAAFEEQIRKGSIGKMVSSVTIPALRPLFAQFADMATRLQKYEADDRGRVYTVDVNGGKVSALEALEGHIKTINAAGATLFKVHSQNDKPELAEDSPDKEVDRLARKYMLDHKDSKVDYATAVQRVLAENPTLKEAYVHRKPAVA